MKIGIITGASSGLGRELLKNAPVYFPEIEEYWIISRSRTALEDAAGESCAKVRIIPLDLTRDEDVSQLKDELKEASPQVELLINNSGCGFLADFDESDEAEQLLMIDLNVRALTLVTHAVLPYMNSGAAVLCISSIASFCPNARMTVYSSTKAYVTSFSRGLRYELRDRKINVCVACPGPMNTPFLSKGGIKGRSKTFETLPYCKVDSTAKGALKAVKKGKAVYTPTPFFKLYRVLAKILPHSAVIPLAKT